VPDAHAAPVRMLPLLACCPCSLHLLYWLCNVPPICCSSLPLPLSLASTAFIRCLLPVATATLPLPLPPSLPQVVGSVAHTLETVIRSVQSSPGEAHDAIRHLLQLKAVGVPAAQRMDPVG
jgi:hypothetical protein